MEKENIEAFIRAYIHLLDQQNAPAVAEYLDPHFRVLITHFKNQNSTLVLTKEQYLAMLENKTMGGVARDLDIRCIAHEAHMAIVSLEMKSATSTMRSYLNLVKNHNTWLVVHDMPELTTH